MKKLLTFCLCLLIVSVCLTRVSFAQDTKEMVYAPPQIQDYLYALIQTKLESEEYEYFKQRIKDNDCEIVKETISPLYEFDILEYARSGSFNIVPYQPKNHERDRLYHCYIAKVISHDGEFAGNLVFLLKTEKRYLIFFTKDIIWMN